MAEEKKDKEKKSKVTKRSQNNPKAKEAQKKTTKKSTTKKEVKKEPVKKEVVKKEVKVEPVKEEKTVSKKELEAYKDSIKKELIDEVVSEIKSETKEAINEVKEVSKEQQEAISEMQKEEVSKPEPVKETKTEVAPEPQVVPTPQVVPVPPVTPAQPVTNVEYETGHPESFFDGGVLGLIGWKLLGFLLSVLTFGILAPLASIFVLKWQYKHTVINGRRLVFDGNYFQLLGRMLLWILLSVITLGIYLFFIPVAWNKWVTKHVHYEGNEKTNTSYFNGNTLQYIGISLLSFLITVLSLGLLYPCAICLNMNWRIKHTFIDGDELEFDGHALGLWGMCFKWLFFTIITLGIYLFWLPISELKWEVKHTNKRGVSKKPYNPVLAVVIPLIVALVIAGGLAFIFITGKVSYDYYSVFNRPRIKEEVDNTKTGSEWGDYYLKYFNDNGLTGHNYEGVFIDLDNDKVPELILKEEIQFCINCDANKEQITILYLNNKRVVKSKVFDNAHLVILYEVDSKDDVWFVRHNINTYTSAKSIIDNDLDSLVLDSDEKENEFEDKYIDLEVDINYGDLSFDKIKKDIANLVSDYENNNSYEKESDSEFKEKLDAYNKKKELLNSATLTNDNYVEKIGAHIKWFSAAYLGATYGWPDIYDYEEVNVKLPNGNPDEMVYELKGLNSINDLKDKLANYVDKDKFNLFPNNNVAYGLTEYNGKVYWASLGVGDGPYLKDYSLESSSNGITKVRLNISNRLTNELEKYIIVTIKYQTSTKDYLITDWEVHLT